MEETNIKEVETNENLTCSKVKITRNSKGVNIEVQASGNDYKNLPDIRKVAKQEYDILIKDLAQ